MAIKAEAQVRAMAEERAAAASPSASASATPTPTGVEWPGRIIDTKETVFSFGQYKGKSCEEVADTFTRYCFFGKKQASPSPKLLA